MLIVFYFGIFGFLHSYLASNKIKNNLALKAGNKTAFYRAFYNIFSILSFVALIEVCPKPDQLIYELRYPYDLIVFALQVICLAGALWSFYSMDLKELSGISQIVKYYKGTFNPEQIDEEQKLIIAGPHRISRHPAYLFIILFLALRPYMDLFYLVFFICTVVYFYIGAYYEEKKIIEKFGDLYIEYKKKVSKIFPLKFLYYKGNNEIGSS